MMPSFLVWGLLGGEVGVQVLVPTCICSLTVRGRSLVGTDVAFAREPRKGNGECATRQETRPV
eukprot:3707146-Amphidinium_carterae.1